MEPKSQIRIMKIVLTLLFICVMHNSLVAQSPAEESVRKWYLAFSKLDSAGFFNFWATNHKNFVYVADGNVLKRDDFLKRMTGILQDIKQVLKADILEGYPYEISNNTESYTAKVLLEGIYTSGISFSTTVTATFVLRKIHGQWKCVQCSASHIRIQSERK